jgi:hypothetical protein
MLIFLIEYFETDCALKAISRRDEHFVLLLFECKVNTSSFIVAPVLVARQGQIQFSKLEFKELKLS